MNGVDTLMLDNIGCGLLQDQEQLFFGPYKRDWTTNLHVSGYLEMYKEIVTVQVAGSI